MGCPVYNTVAFYKDPFGVVHLKGTFKLGGDSIAFELPAGYRPARAGVFPIDVNANIVVHLVIYEGFVQVLQPGGYAGTEVYSLDGISFRAGA